MSETFVGDTVKLVMKTTIDLSGYQALYILYRKPSGTAGYFAASLHSTNNYWMEATLNPTDLDIVGEWTLQAYVEELDHNPVLHGKKVNLTVLEPIAPVLP
jgi:hypothetical protein